MDRVISIVTPTYNRRDSVMRFVQSLATQDWPREDLEVIIVDDGSTDGTVEMLQAAELPFTLRVIEQTHAGPARARNTGVTAARGSRILFLDDDVVPRRCLIAEHAAAGAAAPDRTIVVGPMSPPPATWTRPMWIRWEEEMLQVQYRAMLAGKYACTPRQFYTGNASVPRDLFLQAGGFDDSFTRAEDVELAYRLRDLGGQFVFRPSAGVVHYADRSFTSWCRTPREYGRYDVVMYQQKGHDNFTCMTVEFWCRHPLIRALVHVAAGRSHLIRGITFGLRAVATLSDRMGVRRGSRVALSGIFNLLYWHGAAEQLGGRALLRECLAAAAQLNIKPDVSVARGPATEHA